ncbi:hypothetical protein SHI21_04295 [Bacteriovorax sp. PP10]|uniref:Uncharacterized protein n=1 Tax=Bacteriovorax antarcticus TaxID=3088717 RepID=A0ABU5VQT2_9BACT|nr:hypothetical protein [Bacteriovorax sp. PP10]MEA9355402.1 hypothetical protein [Bacteriovorax sp. PP10]
MKSSILLGLTILLSVSSVFAQDSNKLISIGKNNVDSVSMYDSVLHIVLKDEVDSDKSYIISCENNVLALTVLGGETAQLTAVGKVANCKTTIRDIFDIAFSETMSADLKVSDKTDSQGVYGLSLSYSTSK